MKKLVLLLAVFALGFQTTSCKSKKAQDDTQVVENADVEKIEAEETTTAQTDATATDVGPVDESLQAALGETTNQAATDPTLATNEPAATETTTPEIAAAPTLDEASLNDVPAPSTAQNATSEITETPIVEAPAADTATGANTAMVEPSAPMVTASEAAPVSKPAKTATASASLKKLSESTPYPHGEGWVNTVYIARPKEKLKDISQTIFGMDRTKDLKKLNAGLSNTMKGGEKIYYVSPNRPADSAKMLSYYEDTGMIPEVYVAKKGDNLRKIAENLLGYKNAYKEMWVTNPVVSKSKLEEGESLRYWKSAAAITTPIAHNNTGAQVISTPEQLPAQPTTPPPQQMAANNPPPADLPPPPPPVPDQNAAGTANPPPGQQMAANNPPPADLPPPPPPVPDQNAAGTANPPGHDTAAMTPPPPPPPPQEEIAAAPEAPKKKVVTPNMEEEEASSAVSSDTTMMLGGVVVLCALFAFAIIRRNKKKKEAEMSALSETNVGT